VKEKSRGRNIALKSTALHSSDRKMYYDGDTKVFRNVCDQRFVISLMTITCCSKAVKTKDEILSLVSDSGVRRFEVK
jgi:hypothetical protein